jgi:hypothetical protein
MRTLLTIFTLVFTVMFSSTSFGGWTYLTAEEITGNKFYIDFERIRKDGRFIYYWMLQSSSKRDHEGIMSVKMYQKADCKQFRFKQLSFVFHSKPMGGGVANAEDVQKTHWYYPPPNTVMEVILNSICAFAK